MEASKNLDCFDPLRPPPTLFDETVHTFRGVAASFGMGGPVRVTPKAGKNSWGAKTHGPKNQYFGGKNSKN